MPESYNADGLMEMPLPDLNSILVELSHETQK